MYYTAVMKFSENRVRAQLSLSYCDKFSNNCWRNLTEIGPILGESVFWSKSGSLLLRENSTIQYLFWVKIKLNKLGRYKYFYSYYNRFNSL
jgi:hypothetical protein